MSRGGLPQPQATENRSPSRSSRQRESAQPPRPRSLVFFMVLGGLVVFVQLLVLCLTGLSVSGEANLAPCKGELKFGR